MRVTNFSIAVTFDAHKHTCHSVRALLLHETAPCDTIVGDVTLHCLCTTHSLHHCTTITTTYTIEPPNPPNWLLPVIHRFVDPCIRPFARYHMSYR